MRESGAQRRKRMPWLKAYENAKRRCNDVNHQSYEYYGGKGVKFELTPNDLKDLWFRDQAYRMNKPSIDRVDSSKNYTYDNCRYLELTDNCSRRYNVCSCAKTASTSLV